MAQNIFVSFNFTDEQVAQQVKAMVKAWQRDLVGHIVHGEQGIEFSTPGSIKWQLNRILQQCDVALFVIGDKHQNSPWLRYEIEQALMSKMPIFVTRISDTYLTANASSTPEQLQNDECVKVSWNVDELNACFTQSCGQLHM